MLGNALTIDLVRKIIVEELALPDDRVNIYNQKFIPPKDDKLFVYLEYRGAPTIVSSRNTQDIVNGDFTEIQDLNTLEDITIGLFSKNLEALQYKERAVMALYSIFSQQLQEQESFKIFPNAKITALSMLEATAQLYRFDIDVRVMAWYNNVKTADFFNAHTVQVIVNDGVPDLEVEFEIPDTDPTVYPKT